MADRALRPVGRVEEVEVAVVGGGPAGAALAAQVAALGRDVLVLERLPVWRWRACGVFTSPATVRELRRIGMSAAEIASVTRAIPRLWVESPGGARFALSYGHTGAETPTAVGFDRSRLDPLLLERARAAGARVDLGASVTTIRRDDDGTVGRARPRWRLRVQDGEGEREVAARVLVGADGVRSRVARELGVAGTVPLPRVGLTYHVRDDASAAGGDEPADARMVVLNGAYCGFAPVPGGRTNVGIVLAGGARRRSLAELGARRSAEAVVREAAAPGDHVPLEAIAGVAPISHRVTRRAGDAWLLVGDAAGFLDPFTGEGLHRALVSARLGAEAVDRAIAGRTGALAGYDAAMARRFRGKDLVSLVVQLFVSQPALFDYAVRRLRSRPGVRERLSLLMGDLVPASEAFDPRFLVALLAP